MADRRRYREAKRIGAPELELSNEKAAELAEAIALDLADDHADNPTALGLAAVALALLSTRPATKH